MDLVARTCSVHDSDEYAAISKISWVSLGALSALLISLIVSVIYADKVVGGGRVDCVLLVARVLRQALHDAG